MTACASVAAALLAAGTGSRFGGNKLQAPFRGAMLGTHAARMIAAMGFGWTFAVHDPAQEQLAAAFAALGLTLVPNPDPARGLASSLACAIDAAEAAGAEALLILLADMPLVRTQQLHALLADYEDHPDHAIASACDGVPMPPAIIPRRFWPGLRTATGDEGARSLLKGARRVAADPATMIDIDTVADLGRLG